MAKKKKATDLGRVLDHLGHAYDNVGQSLPELDQMARLQQSLVQKLKNAHQQIGYVNGVLTPRVREPKPAPVLGEWKLRVVK